MYTAQGGSYRRLVLWLLSIWTMAGHHDVAIWKKEQVVLETDA
jgi:hypothetical protein